MNRLEDSDLREALRRREARRMKPEVPADFMDNVMKEIGDRRQETAASRRWRWIVAAASLLLIIGVGAALLINEPTQEKELVAKTELPSAPTTSETIQQPAEQLSTVDVEKPKTQPKRKKVVKPQTSRPEIPDTLGSGIWQSERNVERALQMLSECEAVIEKSEQDVRNNIVKATFNAVPQPANVILVTNEAGDYEIVETKRIIDI